MAAKGHVEYGWGYQQLSEKGRYQPQLECLLGLAGLRSTLSIFGFCLAHSVAYVFRIGLQNQSKPGKHISGVQQESI